MSRHSQLDWEPLAGSGSYNLGSAHLDTETQEYYTSQQRQFDVDTNVGFTFKIHAFQAENFQLWQ